VAACLRDISHRGAFIRTATPAPVGSRLRITMRLPGGRELETIAQVAHVAAEGMGAQFQLDAYSESSLAEALASTAGRPRRVLIVDDDALARRMLADAFESKGVDVLTAPDAELGLHVLAEEILTLDALVTDVRMPGVDGVELVRRIRGAGGEHDLPIVAVTATLDVLLAKQLEAAGANRAVPKSWGPDAIADETLAEISSRRSGADAKATVWAA
jgi:CheY-like chemotaxis protein